MLLEFLANIYHFVLSPLSLIILPLYLDTDLTGGILNDADLRGADLTDAILFSTDLSYTNLSSANLSGSNLNGADLSDANLEEMSWGEKQQWEGVKGLETALNVPEALKQQLGLR